MSKEKVIIQKVKRISYAQAIRKKCLDCCCGQSLEVKLCPSTDCPLHPYRFGKSPMTVIKNNKYDLEIIE